MSDNPTKMVYQLLAQVAEVCARHGAVHAVLSPGSRSAPVALSFIRHKSIRHYVIPDERSAAYTALGISRQLQQPVVVACTSGTASLNYGPAVAEAFFSHIPLIVFTADRPGEWIGQSDNQAIYQQGIYAANIKANYELPVDLAHPDAQWYAIRIVNEAMNTALSGIPGPVHINVPLREPLYIDLSADIPYKEPKVISAPRLEAQIPASLTDELKHYKKILFLAGQMLPDARIKELAGRLIDASHLVVADVTSNLHGADGLITWADLILSKKDNTSLLPDVIISFGGAVVSKSAKEFLRNNKIQAHWHIAPAHISSDTYQRLTKIVNTEPAAFLEAFLGTGIKGESSYTAEWLQRQNDINQKAQSTLAKLEFSEIKAVHQALTSMPENSVLHLGNSLPIRHAAAFPMINPSVGVYSNRGTSGIDGSLSSAVGHAMVSDKQHVLITGDLSFIYDRNGLWNNSLGNNLKVIILNNHGGGIFRELPGSSAQPELEEYFVVKQPLNFEHTVRQHGLEYLYCNRGEEMESSIQRLYSSKSSVVLELDFEEQVLLGDVKGRVAG